MDPTTPDRFFPPFLRKSYQKDRDTSAKKAESRPCFEKWCHLFQRHRTCHYFWYVVKAWCIFLSDEGQSFQTGKYMDFFLLNESQRRAIMAIALQVTASVRALARCHAQPRVCARGVCRCARVWCGRAL